MQISKTIFVTGATGHQGGAVARNLIRQGFHVKALTRNVSSAGAEKLRSQNIEIIQGDLNDPKTYKEHLKGIDGIFCALTFENGIEKEISQGIGLADLAKEYHIDQFIYSSGVGTDLHTGIPHWESKFKIENHIKGLNMPYTIIRPSSFYENFLIPQVKSRLLKGKLVTPANKDKVQQFISTEDVGKIAVSVFINPGKYLRKTISIAATQMSMENVAEIFSASWNKKVTYQKLPGLITRLAMGKNLYKMFRWVNNHDAIFIKDLDASEKEFPGLLDLEQWINLYFKKDS
jgi:uncharacterized protein YbjT (DUF2867 family)